MHTPHFWTKFRPAAFALSSVVAACGLPGESTEDGSSALEGCPTTVEGTTVLSAELESPIVRPGGSLSYTLRFESAPLPRPYKIFVHFLDPKTGAYRFQDDFDPSPATTDWRGVVRQSRTVTIPAGVTGKLPIAVGLYIPVQPYEGYGEAKPGPGVELRDGRFIVGELEIGEPPAPPGTTSIEDVIGDMTKPSSANGRSNNEAAVIFSGNYQQALKLAPSYAPSFDNITSWCWAFATTEHRASNTAVEARYSDVYALRKSTNTWVLVDSGRPSGYRGNRSGATGELRDEVVVDEDTIRVRPGAPPRTDLVSYEMWTPNAAKRIDFVSDIVAVYASCQMRVVTLDPSQPSDLDKTSYAGQVGFDFWRRAAGPFKPGVTQFWGPNGRMKPITTQWQTFSVVTLKPYDPRWSALPGELGFGPAWTVQNPYLDPPYTLTPDQLRANPPPLR